MRRSRRRLGSKSGPAARAAKSGVRETAGVAPVPNGLVSRAVVAALVLVSAFLLLWNLGDQRLWDDEAQTALISQTILDHGLPLGHDGLNSFSQEAGAEFGADHVYKWHPWLPFYLLAAFFRLFGVTTFAARLPFALLGIGCPLLVYSLATALFARRRVAIAAATLLVFSVPFLLLAKQCRYYSPATFLSLLGLYGYASGKHRIVLAPASVLLFYTQNIYFLTLWLAVLIHAALWKPERRKELLLLFTVASALGAPWLIYTLGVSYRQAYPGVLTWTQFLRFLGIYAGQIRAYLFSPFVLLAPAVVMLVRVLRKQAPIDRGQWPSVALLVIYLVVSYLILCSFSVLPFFRYLGPMIPVLCLLTALLLEGLASIHTLVFVAAVAWVILSGNMGRYLYEITHDFRGPIRGITDYLQQNAKPGDTVAITYGDLPIKFYNHLRVVGGLTGEDLTAGRRADWIIMRKHVTCVKDLEVGKYLYHNVDWKSYTPITIDAPDTIFENREDPAMHLFESNTTEDRVVILKRTGG
jgi:4-amino-4-deoxy-L-arabinose transferase-like glycosyltransferase